MTSDDGGKRQLDPIEEMAALRDYRRRRQSYRAKNVHITKKSHTEVLKYAESLYLTLKAPITTAADDSHKYFFIVFQRKYGLMFQVNPLLGRGFI